jgi:hypothetical protein
MTLIVGLKAGDSVRLLTDTRISHPDVTQVEEIPGRLKIVVLNSSLCVAYAGAANLGVDSIRRVAARPGVNVTIAADILRNVTQQAQGAVDFLLASSGPPATLLRISGGQTTEVLTQTWIGDSDGASLFMSAGEALPRRSVSP